MNGSPLISINALGMRSVIGRRRVARPPARIATGSIGISRLGNDGAALKIEAHAHLTQSRGAHRTPQPRFVFGIKHQKTAAAGADQFAPECAVTQGELVVAVDG